MKFAFIAPSGLWIGGVEKYTQQLAIELVLAGHNVDYFYTETTRYMPANVVHPGLDLKRKKLVEDSGVNIVKVNVDFIGSLETGALWNNTDLMSFFDPTRYHAVIGAHKGEPCWPFLEIKGTKIIETVHGTDFNSGASKYADAYVLICEYQRSRWISAGGIPEKTHVISPVVKIDRLHEHEVKDRKKWNIPESSFVFGMHQSSRKGLFSHVPLTAYSLIENENNFFVLLGGTEEYDNYAKSIGIKNFIRISSVSSSHEVNSFLSCLDVYAHGRLDGEVCSSAIIEAMANNLPVITHPSSFNNGHISQIENCGFLAYSVQEYAQYMKNLMSNYKLLQTSKKLTKEKYENHFDHELCRKSLVQLCEKTALS